jgi:hypothetical protein
MSERVALAVITEAGGGGPAGPGSDQSAGLMPGASVLSPCFSLSAHSAMRPRM